MLNSISIGDLVAICLGEIRQGVEFAESRQAVEQRQEASGRGGGIVEFAERELGGKLAESGEFIELLFAAGDFADAVR